MDITPESEKKLIASSIPSPTADLSVTVQYLCLVNCKYDTRETTELVKICAYCKYRYLLLFS